MQFNVAFIATSLFASASLAMSATVTGFTGAGCTGDVGESFDIPTGFCFTLGHGSVKSISYSGVPNEIQFFVSGGGHDSCTNGASFALGGGSGCGTAPDGFNFESAQIF
ncbi:hypothetical protein HYPSUDRAFT_57738 [Hypholoma sublateritium FD-334 SS-4]|uniref:Uncharacterized protein n=1 Tax=Hypholoma sublateritium (strain FD-334 SS-4) TaxID=945553 RepID=A0A0D2NEB1_HYPSF|nr:hypothetical protein HYPSUDRAFT_57738 [Hypholoma sublateritium FD-334 SS-4]